MKILGKYPSVRLRRNRKYGWVRTLRILEAVRLLNLKEKTKLKRSKVCLVAIDTQ